jgi:hypothetical protein
MTKSILCFMISVWFVIRKDTFLNANSYSDYPHSRQNPFIWKVVKYVVALLWQIHLIQIIQIHVPNLILRYVCNGLTCSDYVFNCVLKYVLHVSHHNTMPLYTYLGGQKKSFFQTINDHHLSPYLQYAFFLQWLMRIDLLIQEVMITEHYHTNACKTGKAYTTLMHTKMSKFFHQTFWDITHTHTSNIHTFGDNRFTGWGFQFRLIWILMWTG